MHSTISMQSMVKLGESGDMLPRKIGCSEIAFWAKLLCNAIVCLEHFIADFLLKFACLYLTAYITCTSCIYYCTEPMLLYVHDIVHKSQK